MAARYELWDGESGNLIWTYASETDALAQVREFMRAGGAEAVQGLALVRAEADGSGGVIAEDTDLAALAQPGETPVAAAS